MFTRSVVKFEIPRFGLATFEPGGFHAAFGETLDMDDAEIIQSIKDDGWQLTVIDDPDGNLSRLELVAVWAECHGYGLA